MLTIEDAKKRGSLRFPKLGFPCRLDYSFITFTV